MKNKIPLDKKIWKDLETAYGSAEYLIPLIKQLQENNSKSIANEIIWENIYHQHSVYSSTVATIPYLMEIINNSKDEDFKLDTLLSIGVVLLELETEKKNIEIFLGDSELDNSIIGEVADYFITAFSLFKKIVKEMEENIFKKDEESKRYFLIATAVVENKKKIGSIFLQFADDVEYISVCKKCEEESYLWNEENKINIYAKCPVSDKEQIPNSPLPFENESDDFIWFKEKCQLYRILKEIIDDLGKKYICPHCNTENKILEGIIRAAN